MQSPTNGSQFWAGLNVYVAALLAFATCYILIVAGTGAGEDYIVGVLVVGIFAFAAFMARVWRRHGLVPEIGEGDRRGRRLLGHWLLLIANVIHGAVTLAPPLLIWLGLIQNEALAVLPWFALFSWPLVIPAWILGNAFVQSSQRPTPRPDGSEA